MISISRPAEGSCFGLATVTEFSIPARVLNADVLRCRLPSLSEEHACVFSVCFIVFA